MRLPPGSVTSTRSPARTAREGFAAWPLRSTLPPSHAVAARLRLLKKRAAQSHLSMRTSGMRPYGSTGPALYSQGVARPRGVTRRLRVAGMTGWWTGRSLATAIGLTGALLFLSLPAHPQSGAFLVEDWSKQSVGKTGVPDGWKAQNWGSPKYDFRIVADGPGKVLHMK